MAYHPSLWKNFTATYYDYESFTDLTAQSLTDRGICSVRLSWRRLLRESKKYRVRRNIKLTKLFSKCATSPSVKILYVDEWDIVDNIKEHLPVKSDTLECLTLFPHIYDDYVLRDILKPLVSSLREMRQKNNSRQPKCRSPTQIIWRLALIVYRS